MSPHGRYGSSMLPAYCHFLLSEMTQVTEWAEKLPCCLHAQHASAPDTAQPPSYPAELLGHSFNHGMAEFSHNV